MFFFVCFVSVYKFIRISPDITMNVKGYHVQEEIGVLPLFFFRQFGISEHNTAQQEESIGDNVRIEQQHFAPIEIHCGYLREVHLDAHHLQIIRVTVNDPAYAEKAQAVQTLDIPLTSVGPKQVLSVRVQRERREDNCAKKSLSPISRRNCPISRKSHLIFLNAQCQI